MKEKENYMILINKKEMEYLTKQKGVVFGENGLSKTLNGKYYMTESRHNLSALNDYRDSIKIATVKNK